MAVTINTFYSTKVIQGAAPSNPSFPSDQTPPPVLNPPGSTIAHDPVTIGSPANGLSLVGQQLSIGLASSGVTGVLSGTDWNTFNNKADASTLLNYQPISEKGQPNGYAPLDAGAKIQEIYLPDSITGQVEYIGTWNASTNSPTLANPPASTTKGHYYITTTAGTQFGIEFNVGDWIISNGSSWAKVDNTDAVTSVFGRLGNILAIESDYQEFYPRLSQTYANPTWISSLAWSKITGTPTTLSGYGITDAVPNTRTVTAGAGLTGGGALSANITISHADTSTQASVDNANGTVIQDVTLDTYGHITALGSIDLDSRYYTETEINNFFSGTTAITGYNKSNWDTAFSWGNHAGLYSPETINSITDLNTVISPNFKIRMFTTDFQAANRPDLAVNYFSGMEFRHQLTEDFRTQFVFSTDYSMYLRIKVNGVWNSWNQVYSDSYHPEADKWMTARTLTIGSTGKAVDGSANVSWSLAEIGAQPAGSYALTSTSITAGTGLTGGGDLSANRTLSVVFGTSAGTVAQGNDSRINNGQTAFSWGNHNGQYYKISLLATSLNQAGDFETYYRSDFQPTGRPSNSNYANWFNIRFQDSNLISQLVITPGDQMDIRYSSDGGSSWGSYKRFWHTGNLSNPVTGTGVNNRVAFWNGTGSISNDAGFTWDNTNKNLSVIPTQSQEGGIERIVAFFGNKGSWANNDASLIRVGFTDLASVYNGSDWDFYIKTGSSSGPTEKFRIKGNGDVYIGTTSALTGGGRLQVNGTVNCNDPTADRHAVTRGWANANLAVLRTAGDTGIGAIRYSNTVTAGQFNSFSGVGQATGSTFLRYSGRFVAEEFSSQRLEETLVDTQTLTYFDATGSHIISIVDSTGSTNRNAVLVGSRVGTSVTYTVLSSQGINVSTDANGNYTFTNVSGSSLSYRLNVAHINKLI